MNKFCLKSLFVLLLIGLWINGVIAASLTLTQIGALSTNGAKYSEWWYTAINPTFQGTANSDSDVKIKLDSSEATVRSDSGGNWSYSASLASGDHQVTISSGSESYTFTLHLGQNMPGDAMTSTYSANQTTTSVPDTGYNQMVGVTSAIVLIGAGMYSYYTGMKNQKKIHVKAILRSLDKD